MKSLREYIQEAEEKKVAIGHFNFSNLEGLWAIFNAARNLDLPIILGVSEGERDFVGVGQAAALTESLRKEFKYPVFLNADHTYSFERVKEAIDAGFDMVIFDGVKLPYDENVSITKKCVEYAKGVSASQRTDILVEAELGFIGSGSDIKEEIPQGVSEETQTKPEDAKQFVEETGIDLLAPSVGNIHGMVKTGNPELNIKRIKEVRKAAGVPLVLHGGSGISDKDFVKAIKAGISIIHINTEIRIAYRQGLKLSLQETEEIAPYKYLKQPRLEVQHVVESRLRLFNHL